MDVLVLIESDAAGRAHRTSLEAVAAAQAFCTELGLTAAALVLGGRIDAALERVQGLELGEVLVARDERLNDYRGDAYGQALCQVLTRETPAYLFLGHTYQARDLLPKVSARLGLPLLSDIVACRSDAGQPLFVKQVCNGRLAAELVPAPGKTSLVTLQAAAYPADQARPGSPGVRTLALERDTAALRIQVEAPFRESAEEVDLASAERIVAIGRGIGKQENLGLARELAAALGAELACSRPVVDAGWLPAARQVGSSGQTVSPKLYLALGISGSAQHLMGMKGAQHIVAINKDPEAPIFEVADYGIVGDLLEVVPELTRVLKAEA